MTVFETLLTIREKKGAGLLILIDPDRGSLEDMIRLARACESTGVDGLLIGGSIVYSLDFDGLISALKKAVALPVILFPGNGRQLSRHADAMLFLSLISGRNPAHLIGDQVMYAPTVHAMGLETISTAYMLVESGCSTAVEFVSQTRPLPREKSEIAVAHGLAAQYLGFRLLYLEAGSGAERSVPESMIRHVSGVVDLPIIVGGGIRTPEAAGAKVAAGASFIVVGSAMEKAGGSDHLKSFCEAVHTRKKVSG